MDNTKFKYLCNFLISIIGCLIFIFFALCVIILLLIWNFSNNEIFHIILSFGSMLIGLIAVASYIKKESNKLKQFFKNENSNV